MGPSTVHNITWTICSLVTIRHFKRVVIICVQQELKSIRDWTWNHVNIAQMPDYVASFYKSPLKGSCSGTLLAGTVSTFSVYWKPNFKGITQPDNAINNTTTPKKRKGSTSPCRTLFSFLPHPITSPQKNFYLPIHFSIRVFSWNCLMIWCLSKNGSFRLWK